MKGTSVGELPPNGQGIAALQILNILEGYDLRSAGFGRRATPSISPWPTAGA